MRIDPIAVRRLVVPMLALACVVPPAAAAPATGGEPAGKAPQPVVASSYSHRFTGRKTASGERYDPSALTAAHRTLPLGTKLKVSNPANDRSVVVTVNDRGPHAKGRSLDLSHAAAGQLGIDRPGLTRVQTEVVEQPGKGDVAKQADAGR